MSQPKSAPSKLGARVLSPNERKKFQLLLNNLALGNSPVPSRRSSFNAFNWSVPNSPVVRKVSPRPRSKSKSKSKKPKISLGQKVTLGLLALSALPRAGYQATLRQRLAGHNAGTALMPYERSTAVNIPLPGHASYPAHNRMLFYNNTRQPIKKGFFGKMYNRAKTAVSRNPKKITMRNLKLRQMSHQVRSGAGRRAMEVVNIYTLPSTHNIITHPQLYTNNVVTAAKRAFQNGRKVFSNENFLTVPIFSKAAYNAVRQVQSRNAKPLKNKYIVQK